jgi:hypothetical protein
MDEFFYNFFITENKSGHKTKEPHLLNKYADIHKKIIDFCDNDFLKNLPFNQKIWHFIHQKKEIKLCKECQKPLTFKRSLTEGYGNYCSLSCTNKNKEHKENVKLTNKERYGGVAPIHSNVVKEKIKLTNKERYGVDNTYQNLELVKNGFIKNHGVIHVSKVDGVLDKRRDTNIKKYGYSNNLNNPVTLTKTHNVRRDIFLKKYEKYNFINYNGDTLTIKCSKCDNDYDIRRAAFRHRDLYNIETCTICNPISQQDSFMEREVYEFILSLYNKEIIRNDRTVLNGKELDIYLPDYNLAIEFNGLYWHSEDYVGKNYHLNKTIECEKKGINLLQIFEDEWVYKKEIVKSIIKSRLNSFNVVIYGRKCLVGEIGSKTYKNFCEENHIQGTVNSKIKLGLFYNNELVSIMSFGGLRKSLGSKSIEGHWEMLRFCNKLNTKVIGAASKLFSYFINNYKPKEIVSFSDKRYFSGELYQKLNFQFIKETKPNYYYISDYLKRENRFKYRKDILVKEGFDGTKTEWEIMSERGFDRLWDCGNKKWVWNPNP